MNTSEKKSKLQPKQSLKGSAEAGRHENRTHATSASCSHVLRGVRASPTVLLGPIWEKVDCGDVPLKLDLKVPPKAPEQSVESPAFSHHATRTSVLPTDLANSGDSSHSLTLRTVLSPRFLNSTSRLPPDLDKRLSALEDTVDKDRAESQQLREAVQSLRDEIKQLWKLQASQLQAQLQEALAEQRRQLRHAVSTITKLNQEMINYCHDTNGQLNDEESQRQRKAHTPVQVLPEAQNSKIPDPFSSLVQTNTGPQPPCYWTPINTALWAITRASPSQCENISF